MEPVSHTSSVFQMPVVLIKIEEMFLNNHLFISCMPPRQFPVTLKDYLPFVLF